MEKRNQILSEENGHCFAISESSKDKEAFIHEVLARFQHALTQSKMQSLGFPVNIDFDYSFVAPFLKFAMNNIGDPFTGSSYPWNSRPFEVSVLDWFAQLWEIDKNQYWGYVTSGGTEGNLHGLLVGRELFPDGILYTSEGTHDSIFKVARLYRMECLKVGSLFSGEIDYGDLENSLVAHKDKPAIINLNIEFHPNEIDAALLKLCEQGSASVKIVTRDCLHGLIAVMALSQEKKELLRLLLWWLSMAEAMHGFFYSLCMSMMLRRRQISNVSYTMDFYSKRLYLKGLVYSSDTTCYNLLRMHRATFDKLCCMLSDVGGLKPTKNMLVDEQVAIFLHILAHHVKNRVIQGNFGRSGETISRYFNSMLSAMMHLGGLLFKNPEPVPEDSTDDKWKWFKNCLGALDGTYIKVRVTLDKKARYRNRKGETTTNVLGVCSQDGLFIYVLPGWEGSAADRRVLRDAIIRRNGLKVSQGQYYLVDAGYTNCEGFFAPYRGQRYHLSDWREGRHPRSARVL